MAPWSHHHKKQVSGWERESDWERESCNCCEEIVKEQKTYNKCFEWWDGWYDGTSAWVIWTGFPKEKSVKTKVVAKQVQKKIKDKKKCGLDDKVKGH